MSRECACLAIQLLPMGGKQISYFLVDVRTTVSQLWDQEEVERDRKVIHPARCVKVQGKKISF